MRKFIDVPSDAFTFPAEQAARYAAQLSLQDDMMLSVDDVERLASLEWDRQAIEAQANLSQAAATLKKVLDEVSPVLSEMFTQLEQPSSLFDAPEDLEKQRFFCILLNHELPEVWEWWSAQHVYGGMFY